MDQPRKVYALYAQRKDWTYEIVGCWFNRATPKQLGLGGCGRGWWVIVHADQRNLPPVTVIEYLQALDKRATPQQRPEFIGPIHRHNVYGDY